MNSTLNASFPEIADVKGEEFDELTDYVLKTDFLPDDKDRAENVVKYIFFVANTLRGIGGNVVAISRGEDIEWPTAA